MRMKEKNCVNIHLIGSLSSGSEQKGLQKIISQGIGV